MLTTITAAGEDRPRLFGFHHAGGDPTAYTGWSRALRGDVVVVPVGFPGRDGADFDAVPDYPDLSALADAIVAEQGDRFGGEYLFYGHSMGALVAYRVAQLLVERGHQGPDRLLVGAFPAPHLPHPLRHVSELPEADLTRWLLVLSELPSHLLGGWRLARMVRRLRADLRLCGTHDHAAPVVPLSCPIDVFYGTRDPVVRPIDTFGWAEHTNRRCAFHPVAGGHFFPRDARTEFFRVLRTAIGTGSLVRH